MASSMRRRDHPSFPSEITCCFLSVLKTLLMPSEPIRALSGVNVPGFPMAGFQLTLYGRIWATPEDLLHFDFLAVSCGRVQNPGTTLPKIPRRPAVHQQERSYCHAFLSQEKRMPKSLL